MGLCGDRDWVSCEDDGSDERVFEESHGIVDRESFNVDAELRAPQERCALRQLCTVSRASYLAVDQVRDVVAVLPLAASCCRHRCKEWAARRGFGHPRWKRALIVDGQHEKLWAPATKAP